MRMIEYVGVQPNFDNSLDITGALINIAQAILGLQVCINLGLLQTSRNMPSSH